jgi:hypothetical protein
MDKFYLRMLGTLVFIFMASLAIRSVVFGGVTKSITLNPAPRLTGVVSQSLYSGKNIVELPLAGKDYDLRDIQYFEANKWVVASVQPKYNQFDSGLVVLKLINGSYEVVLGPGSAFEKSSLVSMPKSVGSYLSNKGFVYESVD